MAVGSESDDREGVIHSASPFAQVAAGMPSFVRAHSVGRDGCRSNLEMSGFWAVIRLPRSGLTLLTSFVGEPQRRCRPTASRGSDRRSTRLNGNPPQVQPAQRIAGVPSRRMQRGRQRPGANAMQPGDAWRGAPERRALPDAAEKPTPIPGGIRTRWEPAPFHGARHFYFATTPLDEMALAHPHPMPHLDPVRAIVLADATTKEMRTWVQGGTRPGFDCWALR